MIMSRQKLLHQYSLQGEPRKGQPTRVFSEEMLQSFAILNSGEIGVSMVRSSQKEIGLMPSCSYVNSNVLPDQRVKMGSRSQKNYTAIPYSDGYQWRKYGEKKISGSSFPRSYYRCTYREEKGCQASKQVQQQGHGDPPLFLVTFKGEHTCCSTAADTDDPHPQQCMLQSYQLKQEYSISSHPHHHNHNYSTYHSNSDITMTSHAAATDQSLIISNGRSCKTNNASSPEPPPAAVNPNLMAADFASLCGGFFQGSKDFSGTDDETMMMEPLAFEFDELEALFQILN